MYNRRRNEMDFNDRNLATFLDERISELSRDDPFFEYLDDAIRRSRQTRENLINFVFDSMEMLVDLRKEPDDLWEGAIELASFFAGALIKEDRSVDIPDRRTEDDMLFLADNANKLRRALEEYAEEADRGRRFGDRGRDDRRGGFGRSSGGFGRGREEERRGRYEGRGRDERRGRYEDRDDRGRSSGGFGSRPGRYESAIPTRGRADSRREPAVDINAARNNRRRVNPYVATARMREQANGNEVNRDERDDFEMPDPRTANAAPAYERVEPHEVTRPASFSKKKAAPAEPAPGYSSKGNRLANRPITREDIESGLIKLDDYEVVMSIPLHPNEANNHRPIAWEVDSVRPVWDITSDGYRYMAFEPLTAEEVKEVDRKIHELNVIGAKEADNRYHPKNAEIRKAIAGPRFNVKANRELRDQDRQEYEAVVASIKEENSALPPEEQKVVPEAPNAGTISFENILRSDETVKGFGLGHIRMQEMSRTEEMTNDQNGHLHTNFNAFQTAAESYEPIYTCATPEEARFTLRQLEMTGLNFNDNIELSYIQDIHDNLKRVIDRVPVALVVAAKRHIVELVNSIFRLEMGCGLRIESFEDLATLADDVTKARGAEFAKKLAGAFSFHLANFQMFKLGSGIIGAGVNETTDARTIYVVKRINMVIAPMLVNDLKLRISADAQPGEIFFVSQETSPKLHNALKAMNFNAGSDIACLNYIWFADNSWLEVRKDYQDAKSDSFVLALRRQD